MELVHKFKQDDQYFLIDVNSGSLHVIDKLIYDMITDYSKLEDRESIIKRQMVFIARKI